jgi:hypothetical protein
MPGVSVDTIIPATVFAHFRKVFAADADVSFSTANSGALAIFMMVNHAHKPRDRGAVSRC